MSYTHLTENERYQIKALLLRRVPRKEIAEQLGRSPSTIKREIKRNRVKRLYDPAAAQELACARLRSRAQANARHVDPEVWEHVHQKLECGWSPQQVAGRMRLDKAGSVSHESIYLHVYEEKRAGGHLWRYLACHKARRKRGGAARARRQIIPNRVPIDQRPAIVESKTRFGDFEGDTVLDSSHSRAIVSIVDRKSMYLVLAKVEQRTTENVCQAIIRGIKKLGIPARTLTLDNGTEFCGHERITEKTGMHCYFAKPYAAWQRGLNENHNGLIRRYIPKGQSLAQYTQEDIQWIADELNSRPRKRLGYRTPNELILGYLSRKNGALRS